MVVGSWKESLRKIKIELIFGMGMIWKSSKKQRHAGHGDLGEGDRCGGGPHLLFEI